MMIPIANALFGDYFNFKKFLKKEKYSKCPLDNLEFRKVDSKFSQYLN